MSITLITVSEAALLMNVTKASTYRFIRERLLDKVIVHGRTMVTVDSAVGLDMHINLRTEDGEAIYPAEYYPPITVRDFQKTLARIREVAEHGE